MKLHEYQAKGILAGVRHPRPRGAVAATPAEARGHRRRRSGGAVMVKAQVLVGGRGKAGGVKMAKNPEEAEARAREILGMKIKGIEVTKVLVARAVDIASEYYVSLTVDRSARSRAVHRQRLGRHGDRGGRRQGAGEDRALRPGSARRAW